jgi:hypothetical protein
MPASLHRTPQRPSAVSKVTVPVVIAAIITQNPTMASLVSCRRDPA